MPHMKICDRACKNQLYECRIANFLSLRCYNLVTTYTSTVGRINFEDKKFRGFQGYLLNLEIKYPRKFPA